MSYYFVSGSLIRKIIMMRMASKNIKNALKIKQMNRALIISMRMRDVSMIKSFSILKL
jgi:hypothetical protein